ncbi:MAG: DUF2231 domain-containing protein [Aquificota bacterium]|nr:DUF2231 domain-containing protein [Aquificota bacterium]
MKRFIIILCAPLLFSLFSFAHREEAVIKQTQEQPQKVEKIVYPPVVKYHPPAVHFAVALPAVTLILQAFYILRNRKPDGLEFLFILMTSGAVAGAAVTGYVAHESIEDIPIRSDALNLLHTHETLGIYLALFFGLIFILRLLYWFKPSGTLRFLYVLLLLLGSAVVLFQGNLGGKLVYDFGLGVSG